MDIRQLRYFVAVARERNFTRAAQVLNIAQPALSRQIQAIEEELGVDLVLRKSRPVRLTDAGRLFYEQSMQILGRVEQMCDSTRRVGLNQNSVFSIGFVGSVLYGGLPVLLRKLRKHAPDLDIQLLEMVTMQQIPALKEGRIDVGFGRFRAEDPAIASVTLREERLSLAMPPSSPLAKEEGPVSITDLAGQRLIVYPKEPRPGYADQVLGLLMQHEIHPATVHDVRELQTALGLVAAEAGLCIVPDSATQARSDVVFRQIAEENVTSPVILHHRAGDESHAIALVKQLLEEIRAETGT